MTKRATSNTGKSKINQFNNTRLGVPDDESSDGGVFELAMPTEVGSLHKRPRCSMKSLLYGDLRLKWHR